MKNLLANVVGISVLSFCQSLQLLILIAVVFSLIPIPTMSFVAKLFPVYLPEVRPEREMMLYRLFVILAISLQGVLVFINRKQMESPALREKIISYLGVVAFWLIIELTAVFKFFVFGSPLWARVLLYLALGLNILSLIFWPELKKSLMCLWQVLIKAKRPGLFALLQVIIVGLCMILFIPDLNKVLAGLFTLDRFYHLDSFLMAPGWAYLKGLSLNTDVTSEYSVALPVILSKAIALIGGFNYANAVSAMIVIVLGYYIAFYIFVRHWLKSVLLGILALVLSVKLQFFHWGVLPLVWQYPSATALRFWPDVIFFMVLYKHSNTRNKQWLLLGAVINGFLIAWMMDIGIYLLASFCVYLFFYGYDQRMNLAQLISLGIKNISISLAVAFILIVLCSNGHALTLAFWKNNIEFASLFLQGWGALPMTEGLKDKQFLAFIIGFAIPVFYVFSLISVGALLVLRKIHTKNSMVIFLSVYGLGLYHYFINRSAVTSYDVVSIPLVLLICFWVQKAINLLKDSYRLVVLAGVVFLVMGALLTSYGFTIYPNVLHLNGANWQQEEDFYQQDFNFKEDAALIDGLTTANERVALLSSFETKILMDANRAPFFYYFPMMESAHMQSKEIRGTYLHTQQRLTKTIQQLEDKQPAYFFVEEKLLNKTQQVGLNSLISYVSSHYKFAGKGRYLIAFKRN